MHKSHDTYTSRETRKSLETHSKHTTHMLRKRKQGLLQGLVRDAIEGQAEIRETFDPNTEI